MRFTKSSCETYRNIKDTHDLFIGPLPECFGSGPPYVKLLERMQQCTKEGESL